MGMNMSMRTVSLLWAVLAALLGAHIDVCLGGIGHGLGLGLGPGPGPGLAPGMGYGYGLMPEPSRLEIAKQWKLLDYDFPQKLQLPVNDPAFYNPQNILITGIAIAEDRIFMATPKLFSGVPSTLNFVPKSGYADSPTLQAYPDWSYYTTGRTDFNCSDLVLISVYRLRIDSCNRLWVLDAGVSRSLEDYEITCPPKILIFDLNSNEVVRRVDFPKEILRGETLFTNLVIDETTSRSPTCDDVFAYISDTVEAGIIVYDSGRDVTWRVSHPAMYPDPDFGESEILGHRFVLMDGVVGLAFDPNAGLVYFQPLATDRIFSVHKNVLRAGPIAINQVLDVKLVGKKSSQGIGIAASPLDGTLLFSPMSETAIASWNPATNKQAILAQNREALQFVADITFTASEPNVVYAISSKFHRFFLKNLNVNEVNNRIVRLDLSPHSRPHLPPPPPPPPPSYYVPSQSLKPLSTSVASPASYARPPVSANSFGYARPPKVPYSFQHLLDYNANKVQPAFNSLQQGEPFPPPKGQRNSYQMSFLDGLATAPASQDSLLLGEQPHGYQSLQPTTGGNYYFYDRQGRAATAKDRVLTEEQKKK